MKLYETPLGLGRNPHCCDFWWRSFRVFFHLSWPPPKKLDIPNSQKYDSSKVDVQNIGTFYFCSFCGSTDLLLLEFSARGSCWKEGRHRWWRWKERPHQSEGIAMTYRVGSWLSEMIHFELDECYEIFRWNLVRNFECLKSLFQKIATHIEAKSQSTTKRFAMFGAKKNGYFWKGQHPSKFPVSTWAFWATVSRQVRYLRLRWRGAEGETSKNNTDVSILWTMEWLMYAHISLYVSYI